MVQSKPSQRLKRYLVRVRIQGQRGQQAVEYSLVSVALLGGMAGLSWPFLVRMINALGTYYASLFWVISQPLD